MRMHRSFILREGRRSAPLRDLMPARAGTVGINPLSRKKRTARCFAPSAFYMLFRSSRAMADCLP